jgi:hypothetical protein
MDAIEMDTEQQAWQGQQNNAISTTGTAGKGNRWLILQASACPARCAKDVLFMSEKRRRRSMSNVVSNQQARATLSSSRERLRSVTLWIMQGALALLFLFTGGSKLLLPTHVLLAQMALPLPIWFLRLIGVIEVAGALGLILPQLTRIKPGLTPLAAGGLALEMVGATLVTVIALGVAPALFPLVVGLLAAFVAYGRGPRWRSA